MNKKRKQNKKEIKKKTKTKNSDFTKKTKNRLKFEWQRLLFAIFFLIFILIILFKFSELRKIWILLQGINYFWIIIALFSQTIVFLFLAALYNKILSPHVSAHKKLTLTKKKNLFFYFFKTAISMLFIDYAVPSFSASGNILLYYAARKTKTREDKAALLIGLNVFLNFLFFLIIFIGGAIYLVNLKALKGVWYWITPLIIILFFILYRILWTETGKKHFGAFISFLLKRFPKGKERVISGLLNFHKAKKELKRKRFIILLVYTFFIYIFKIFTIEAVFFSLGYTVDIGTLIIGYLIASVLSMLSYIRIGIYEASMTTGYSLLGIPFNLALTATLLYRAIAFWLPMLIGFLLLKPLFTKRKI